MSLTIKDVAQRAGVSISTVSRVLNDTCPVSRDKRKRVEAAVKELNFSPNPAARSLLMRKTKGLGVLLPFVGGEFFAELLGGIDQAAQSSGYFLLISTSHRSEGELKAALSSLHKRVDGLIIMAPEMASRDIRAQVSAGEPIVFVNTRARPDDEDVFNFDNQGGSRMVTRHLLELGHRNIAFIEGPRDAFDAQERIRGWRQALGEYGLPYQPEYTIQGDYTREAGFDAVRKILEMQPTRTAIVCSNDQCAIGALSALREARIRVPDEISIVGFDDTPSSRYSTPPLTSVRVPVREIGKAAIARLVDRIGGVEGLVGHMMFEVELAVRESTGPPSARTAVADRPTSALRGQGMQRR